MRTPQLATVRCRSELGCCCYRIPRFYLSPPTLSAVFGQSEYSACGGETSDSMNPFYGECGTSDGIVAICGTGSSAFAYKNGIIHRVDGHGYLLGDESGGYRMGQMALNAALREEDGRGPKTILTQLCRQKAGKPIMDALAEINDGGKTVIASYARCLLEARERNDGVAVRLMDGIENTMAETIIAEDEELPEITWLCAASSNTPEDNNLVLQEFSARLGIRVNIVIPTRMAAMWSLLRARTPKRLSSSSITCSPKKATSLPT